MLPLSWARVVVAEAARRRKEGRIIVGWLTFWVGMLNRGWGLGDAGILVHYWV